MNNNRYKLMAATLLAGLLASGEAWGQTSAKTTTIGGSVYGGGALANTGATTVNLTGGTVMGDVYGGGKGQIGRAAQEAQGTEGEEGYVPAVAAIKAVQAMVNGDVSVTLNGTRLYNSTDKDDQGNDISASGRVFGCNNLNGWPTGSVTVTVEKTVPWSGKEHKEGTYDVAAVYGGGNLAEYEPNGPDGTQGEEDRKKTKKLAHVIINGCEDTSIYQVYGGGNAASTPATQVDINGTFEIEEVFGGGNGKDRIAKNGVWQANPGANVGYSEYADNADDAATAVLRSTNYGYGTGEAKVNIKGGRIHHVYGGSNTKGNVRHIAMALLEELQTTVDGTEVAVCHFDVDEAYGGGKSATMDGEARLEMKCIPGMAAAYGGAENADIHNSVTLSITNGKYGQVFGGNNLGGRINGAITVNIEETGCRPIIIGELYGGGNQAAYSVYGYEQVPESNEKDAPLVWKPREKAAAGETPFDNPKLNVKSFTSIGNVYGGGYGATALMVGNPEVNINVVVGDKASHAEAKIDSEGEITITETIDGKENSRTVNYPTHEQGKIGAINNVFGGGNAAKVIGNTFVNIGTEATVTYDDKSEHHVVGVDIRGNVYGGGNAAEVTGNTNVVIGKKNE